MNTQNDLIDSASILVIRDQKDGAGLEVLMVRRNANIVFAGGAYVFPGGKVDSDDFKTPISISGFMNDYDQFITTAIREVYEETGIIIGDLSAPVDDHPFDKREQFTGEILENIDKGTLQNYILPYARWITPRAYKKRFDTRFFLALAPKGQEAVPDQHEIVEAIWVDPGKFIEEQREKMMFPTIMNLKLLAEAKTTKEAMELTRKRKIIPVEPKLVDGIRVIDPNAGYGEIDQGNIHPGEKNNPL